MGRINNELNQFFRDNRVFADLINLCIYQGRQTVEAGDLEDEDTALPPENFRGKRLERCSDVNKRCRCGHSYRLFCLENESKISYIMPVRGMEYEVGRYREQADWIAKEHAAGDYRNWDEKSSRFTGKDRLHPVITLVLYWQKKPWDGAKRLIELLSENPEYRDMDIDTGRVASALLGIPEYVQEREGGQMDMCKALEELCADARMEGLKQGMEKGMEKQKIELLCKKLRRTKSVEQIAERWRRTWY